MKLAPRLILSFVFLAGASSAGLGALLREDRRLDETRRFDSEVVSACARVAAEAERQAESDRKLVAGACQSGELVDRALVAIDSGEIDQRRLALAALIPKEREAFDLDELLLAAAPGDVLGADPRSLLGIAPAQLQTALATGPGSDRWFLRPAGEPASVARCTRLTHDGRAVGLLGARHLAPLVARFGKTAGVAASLGGGQDASGSALARCTIVDSAGTKIPISVGKSKAMLDENLARIDRTVLLAALASTGAALLLAILLARAIGRPIEELAREARKVASDQARPLEVRGTGELAELAQSFDRMLDDLAVTRRRLAAASRVAAWREVARRVAHEVKNPLAPIRAAVETLRRLRARQDPAFDEYFDEATRTVLTEVHRISEIVTEFTRFARLPAPRPQEIDVVETVRHVVQLHRAAAGDSVRLVEESAGSIPPIQADRDQVIQVLTNLVQNAIDAVKEKGGTITVTTVHDAAGHVTLTVSDDGHGIAPEISARLFEPYATTKVHGTGLGLAIAQRIALEHNGELSYVGQANPGARAGSVGSRFRLVLPVDGPPPASAEATPAPTSS